ncbi:MAG: hypothetical protein ACI8QZ_003228 [Chlamydiales bacterium]|jgi:hypothetical protein
MPAPAHRSVPDRVDRLEQAMAFLQEAVYQSRAAQASSTGLGVPAAGAGGAGQCGLGEKAAVVLDLTERGQTLFTELWPQPLDEAHVEGIRSAMADWIERQDALDRKRNHFMKDFRNRHGFDRSAYTEAQTADWNTGLATVNDDVNARLQAKATELLAQAD